MHKKNIFQVDLKPSDQVQSSINLEVGMLKRLEGKRHVVKYKDHGSFGSYKFVIMELAGRNLSSLHRHCPNCRLTNSTTVRITLQSLEAIKDIHDTDFVHRDIKASNFAMGRSEANRRILFILDFGLVRRYRLKDRSIRPARPNPGFRGITTRFFTVILRVIRRILGTIRYASVNTHNRLEIGRHDDLISWLYMAVEIHRGKLKWRSLGADVEAVGRMKAKITEEELFGNMDPEFKNIYRNLLTLNYESEPRYAYYRQQLEKIIERKGYSMDAPFDWDQGGSHFEHTKYVKNQPYGRQMAAKGKEVHQNPTPAAEEEEEAEEESSDDDD